MVSSARLCGLTEAVIVKLWQETPTVRGLTLRLDGANKGAAFTFKPGQWVDFHVPGLDSVGGYSICSSQLQLQHQGTIDLCVKASRHPCAQWIHQQAATSAQVHVKVGGTFTLLPDSSSRPSLFVAGGIGITALSSMIADLVEQQQGGSGTDSSRTRFRPWIMYSGTDPSEFALLKQLVSWHLHGYVHLQLHTTRVHGIPSALQELNAAGGYSAGSVPRLIHGRIDRQHLQSALQELRVKYGVADVVSYVCGPPQMTDEVTHTLRDLGLAAESVHSERWW